MGPSDSEDQWNDMEKSVTEGNAVKVRKKNKKIVSALSTTVENFTPDLEVVSEWMR